MTTTDLDWDVVGFSVECDATVYKVAGKFQDIEGCQKSCEADVGCLAITYFFAGGLCKHFNTPCTKTKSLEGTVSYQLKDRAQATTTKTGSTTTTKASSTTPAATTTTRPSCPNWCRANGSLWPKKCGWAECSGCSECSKSIVIYVLDSPHTHTVSRVH